MRTDMICPVCGSVLSAVTFTCVRGEYCKPPIAGRADAEREGRIDAERVTWEMKAKSTRRVDGGRKSIEDSPLFGGPRQGDFFQ